jgi:hypothetical protein
MELDKARLRLTLVSSFANRGLKSDKIGTAWLAFVVRLRGIRSTQPAEHGFQWLSIPLIAHMTYDCRSQRVFSTMSLTGINETLMEVHGGGWEVATRFG